MDDTEPPSGWPSPDGASSPDDEQGIEVPYTELPPETLQRVLEEFVTRDGTDYGLEETPLDRRVSQLLSQLQRGDARILFSHQTQSINIVRRE